MGLGKAAPSVSGHESGHLQKSAGQQVKHSCCNICIHMYLFFFFFWVSFVQSFGELLASVQTSDGLCEHIKFHYPDCGFHNESRAVGRNLWKEDIGQLSYTARVLNGVDLRMHV